MQRGVVLRTNCTNTDCIVLKKMLKKDLFKKGYSYKILYNNYHILSNFTTLPFNVVTDHRKDA